MPDTRGGVISLCKLLHAHGQDVVVYVEKINGYVPKGANRGFMFEFGAQCERVECIFQTLGARIVSVRPQDWQAALHLGHKSHVPVEHNATPETLLAVQRENGRLQREWKRKLRDQAEKLYPKIKVTLANCDALLILRYAEMQESGQTGAHWLEGGTLV